MTDTVYQKCLNPDCGATFDVSRPLFACTGCGDLLDVRYDWDKLPVPGSLAEFQQKWSHRNDPLSFSGVWRFHDLLPFCRPEHCVTVGEGQTILQQNDNVGKYAGMNTGNLYLQYEGMNPSGSFKDNGMAAGLSHARLVGASHVACASTGNTSASLALYAHACGITCTVFIGSGKIAYGKLSQALDYGAQTIQIQGDFDDCMKQVKDVCADLGLYLVNSLNPFRLEGQKTVMLRVLEQLNWEVPDWIIVPGGNLGNSSAFGKAFLELLELGLIDKAPRLAVINARGANTLYELYDRQGLRFHQGQVDNDVICRYYRKMDDNGYRADTIASAIEIARPVNLKKCLRALEVCDGVVREVDDPAILDAKAQIGLWGLGCEPASAASVAGLKLLRAEGVIGADERVVCVLTGHQLKDPNRTVSYHMESQATFSNKPIEVANDIDAVVKAIQSH